MRSFLICLVLFFIPSLLSCTKDGTLTPQLKYELSQLAYQPELETSLQLQTNGNTLNFSNTFSGGGGSYDKARLEISDNNLRIILFDADGIRQKMFVIYKVSGTISGLAPGNYTLQTENSDGDIVAKGSFEIQ